MNKIERITLEIDKELIIQLKEIARDNRVTLDEVIDQLLRYALDEGTNVAHRAVINAYEGGALRSLRPAAK